MINAHWKTTEVTESTIQCESPSILFAKRKSVGDFGA
jgi:hypothetical protein